MGVFLHAFTHNIVLKKADQWC